MRIVLHPEAEAELDEAERWYEERAVGLGLDFLFEVDATVGRIRAFPRAWPEVRPGIRRALVHRFPFGLLYAPSQDLIYVVAVMHLSRKPGYWRDRLR